MKHRGNMQAEPRVQSIFSLVFSSLLLAVPILLTAAWHRQQPSRWPRVDRVVPARAEQVLARPGLAAWKLSAPDPRFGGLSALAIERGRMIAITDSGVVLRFAPPRRGDSTFPLALHDLPDGPGSADRKWTRDSEALLADHAGRGWWVAFENRHSLWLFDRSFSRAIERRFLDVDWSANGGGEAVLAGPGGAIMVLPEGGGRAVGGAMVVPTGTADAARLPDGRAVLLVRRMTPRGFATWLHIAAGAGRPARRIAVDHAPLDNMEGIAVEPLGGGAIRLWIVSDDNFRASMRTVLVALDLPPGT